MGVKAVVLRHDDHDQEMKGVYKILHFAIFVLFAFSGRQIFKKLPIKLMVICMECASQYYGEQ